MAKKGVNSKKTGFSIDIEVDNQLKEYCESNLINKSKLVTKLIRDYLEKMKVRI
jgi:hypothetical protein